MTLSRTQGGHRTNVSFQIRDGNASVHRGGVNCIKEWEIYLCICIGSLTISSYDNSQNRLVKNSERFSQAAGIPLFENGTRKT